MPDVCLATLGHLPNTNSYQDRILGNVPLTVHIAYNVRTDGEGNLLTFQLVHSLSRRLDIRCVQHGTAWLTTPGYDFDICHIHWPEALFNFRVPTKADLAVVEGCLDRIRKRSAIVCTIHNLSPHYINSDTYQQGFRLVYERSDGIVHMGSASEQLFSSRYGDITGKLLHQVIPHGDYALLHRGITRQEAREKLELPEEVSVVLCFGSIRDRVELRLAVEAFKGMPPGKRTLLIVGRLPHARRRSASYYYTRAALWVSKSIRLVERSVPSREVALYLSAADIVFIPRVSALNSGNVALGFTFGKVVVGPDIGVIGETLRALGNPVFDPHSREDVVRALVQGEALVPSGQGARNHQYARENMCWDTIAEAHAAFYKRVRRAVADRVSR